MNAQEMKCRYTHLFEHMTTSQNVEKMEIFGRAERKIFEKLVETHPSIAKEWLDMLEAVCWNNFLTEEQAKEIAGRLINQDGSTGPKWSMEAFFAAVPKLGGKIEVEPHYNKYALWMVANAHYSDFAKSTSEDMGYQTVEDVPFDKMALSMYKKAVESLMDIDRQHYIADCYHL